MKKNMSKNMSFEGALKRLEKIVEEMENGGAELEESLGLFEEGVKLVKYCSSKLDEAKKKIEILIKSGDTMKSEKFKDKGGEEE